MEGLEALPIVQYANLATKAKGATNGKIPTRKHRYLFQFFPKLNLILTASQQFWLEERKEPLQSGRQQFSNRHHKLFRLRATRVGCENTSLKKAREYFEGATLLVLLYSFSSMLVIQCVEIPTIQRQHILLGKPSLAILITTDWSWPRKPPGEPKPPAFSPSAIGKFT